MRNEFTANEALSQQAAERARWAAVLAPAAKTITYRRAVRKSILTRFLGLFA